MVTEGQKNLETVIFDYLGALRDGDQEAVRAVLDPNVTWQGLHDEWVCHGPDEVIETLQEGLRLRRDVAALEFVRAGSRLVMGVRGPSLDEVGGEPLGGQIFNVFRSQDPAHPGRSGRARGAASTEAGTGWTRPSGQV